MYALFENFLTFVGGLASIISVCFAASEAYKAWKRRRRLTWDGSLRAGKNILEKIETDGWKPAVVVGIGRSGGIWGGWLAGNLGSLPFEVVDYKMTDTPDCGRQYTFPSGRRQIEMILDRIRMEDNSDNDKPRILLVEGAVSTGGTFTVFMREFGDLLRDYDIKTATLFLNPAAAFPVHYVGCGDIDSWPTAFPWHFRKAYRTFLRHTISK